METAYAQALWKLVQGGPGRAAMTPHAAVKAVREKLERDGRVSLMPRVRRAFARLAEREANKNTMVLTVAREKDERTAKSAAKEVLASLGANDLPKEAGFETRVDDTIIGGWRLEGRGVLVDNSYKSKLLSIYNRVIN